MSATIVGRIQILPFANGVHGAVECLHIIPSPYRMLLAGLCLSGERAWCLGQARGMTECHKHARLPSFFTACVYHHGKYLWHTYQLKSTR